MKPNFWPFNKKTETKEYIIVKNVPLQQVECSVLKEEIARRKKENYECRVREANIKADHVDKLIDELCKEIRKDIKIKTNKTYKEKLASKIVDYIMDNVKVYKLNYAHSYMNSQDSITSIWYDDIQCIASNIEKDAINIINIFEYMKSEYRKTLFENIEDECH
jgi:hypothetical protein